MVSNDLATYDPGRFAEQRTCAAHPQCPQYVAHLHSCHHCSRGQVTAESKVLLLELQRERFHELFGPLSELERINYYYKVTSRQARRVAHCRALLSAIAHLLTAHTAAIA